MRNRLKKHHARLKATVILERIVLTMICVAMLVFAFNSLQVTPEEHAEYTAQQRERGIMR